MFVHDAPPLASGGFDRDASTRLSEQALDAAWSEPGSLLLRVHDGKLPIRSREDGSLELELVPVGAERGAQHFYLGRISGGSVFAAVVEHDAQGDPEGDWQHPFVVGPELGAEQRELLTVAMALINWNTSMPYSPRDGRATTAAQGGWARIDESGAEHFPRTDPAVIVLVEHEGRVLLGSNVLWETGRFSLLAGFVEAGESAEQTVVREVFEEAGVRVEDVRYVASQPWPFPRSLMLGFRARLARGADPAALRPDTSEISELRWFTRDEIRDPGPGLRLPGGLSIARWLVDLWLEEDDSAPEGDRAR